MYCCMIKKVQVEETLRHLNDVENLDIELAFEISVPQN